MMIIDRNRLYIGTSGHILAYARAVQPQNMVTMVLRPGRYTERSTTNNSRNDTGGE